MLYKGLYIENQKELKDVRVVDGRFEEIGVGLAVRAGEAVLDFGGKLMLPPFVESHVHLDTVLTAGDPRHNMSGTLFEGIEIWSERKKRLSKSDVKERAERAVRMMQGHGVGFIRSHVDCTDRRLVAMEAMLELRDELKDEVDIQIVAFPQEGILSYPDGYKLLESSLQMGADCVGAIPHFEFTREYGVESINCMMKLAEKYGVLVDVHCDEIDYGESHGLEVLACRALESGLKERVTASHTTAMHSYNDAYVQKLIRLLVMSEINFVANPLVNTHLQGRIDHYPKRRGLTRVRELLANGLNVAFGHDDIKDPWYPMGTGNPMDVISLGIHVCQLMGYEEIMGSYRFYTHAGARCLQLGKRYGIEVGKEANFIVLDAVNWYEALNERVRVLKQVRRGKVVGQ